MPGDADTQKKEKGFVAHLFAWVAWGFFVLAVYVLSYGLAVKTIWTPGALNQTPALTIVDYFYAPVIWVYGHNYSFNRFMTWYMERVWGVHDR
jgi:hypothetical protein